jgi:hypothetical protein
MKKTSDWTSEYNTETRKYTGPLAIVTYTGPKNAEDQMVGEGSALFANGSTYTGGFANDMLNGKGILTDVSTGTKYTGDFLDDMRHGYGVFEYPDGKYEGKPHF